MATTPQDNSETGEAKAPSRKPTTTTATETGGQTSVSTGDEDVVSSDDAPQGFFDQASATARKAATRSKDRAAGGIDELAGLIEDVAKAIDYRIGDQYGVYARKAATAISGVSGNLKAKEVDELLDDAREFVRKQPGIALGAAAAIGFALTRLVKAGDDDDDRRGNDRDQRGNDGVDQR